MNNKTDVKILSIIGTRPQYIKIKPIFDYCKSENIDHYIADTRQHYSHNVSGALIEDLELNIDFSLSLESSNELSFMAECTLAIRDIILSLKPDAVLVYGDTNSTFCAALAAYKLGVPIAHIEAGERCHDNSVPEEVTRKFVDEVSTLNFCSSSVALENLDEAVLCGDLEYELLNNVNPDILFEDFGVMTIHRQANCSKERIGEILSFCEKIPMNIKFFAHHRTLPLLPSDMPDNVLVYESCPYSEMIRNLSKCTFIITDSGSIQKTSGFFGKRALVMRERSEWKKTEASNFAKLAETVEKDIDWLLKGKTDRDKRLYLSKYSGDMPSKIIISSVMNKLGDGSNNEQE